MFLLKQNDVHNAIQISDIPRSSHPDQLKCIALDNVAEMLKGNISNAVTFILSLTDANWKINHVLQYAKSLQQNSRFIDVIELFIRCRVTCTANRLQLRINR